MVVALNSPNQKLEFCLWAEVYFWDWYPQQAISGGISYLSVNNYQQAEHHSRFGVTATIASQEMQSWQSLKNQNLSASNTGTFQFGTMTLAHGCQF